MNALQVFYSSAASSIALQDKQTTSPPGTDIDVDAETGDVGVYPCGFFTHAHTWTRVCKDCLRKQDSDQKGGERQSDKVHKTGRSDGILSRKNGKKEGKSSTKEIFKNQW